MEDRQTYHRLADAERRAAQRASDVALVRHHVDRAREFAWLAVTQPYPADDAQREHM